MALTNPEMVNSLAYAANSVGDGLTQIIDKVGDNRLRINQQKFDHELRMMKETHELRVKDQELELIQEKEKNETELKEKLKL